MRLFLAGMLFFFGALSTAGALPRGEPVSGLTTHPPVINVQTCKSYRSCAQAVRNWCAGNHPRADGDGDGIPCENVCRSRKQVTDIQRQIGCKK